MEYFNILNRGIRELILLTHRLKFRLWTWSESTGAEIKCKGDEGGNKGELGRVLRVQSTFFSNRVCVNSVLTVQRIYCAHCQCLPL